MIFTEQENIDDVNFFPLLRPSISPVNASIYGIHESLLAPVEDLALSFEDFEALCAEGVLQPHARHLTLRPHIRLWSARTSGKSRASAHVEIEGFLAGSVLRVAGFRIRSEQPISEEEEKKKITELIEVSLPKFLRKTFPQTEIIVSPATVLHNR
jgi:hypothetical protein